MALALIESSAMAIGFGRQGLLLDYNAWNIIIAIVTMTTGSALLMWIGEQITDKGVETVSQSYCYSTSCPVCRMI